MRDPTTRNMSGLLYESERVCHYCGEVYTCTSHRGKYCSRKCLQKYRYEHSMLNPEWRLNRLVSMAKNRATTKQVPFDIDTNYMMELWSYQNGKCAVSGIDLDLIMSKEFTTNPEAPSIDRIVPNKGYVKGNVRIVCYQVNAALSEYGEEQLLKMCEAIVAFR